MLWTRRTLRRFSVSSTTFQDFQSNLKELLFEEGRTQLGQLNAKYRERFGHDIPTDKQKLSSFLEGLSWMQLSRKGAGSYAELKSTQTHLEPKIIDAGHQLVNFRSNSWYETESVVAIDCEGVPSNHIPDSSSNEETDLHL